MGKRYEFDEFILDTQEGWLLRSNEPLKATPRLLALLEALVDRRGRLVEKKELLDRVWEGTSVGEANLTVQVSKLRRLLGETEDRVFIETVPTRGYRFLVPVRVVPPAATSALLLRRPAAAPVAPSTVLPPAAESPPGAATALDRRPFRWWSMGLAAGLVTLVGVVWVASGGDVRHGLRGLVAGRDVGPAVGAGVASAPAPDPGDTPRRLTDATAVEKDPVWSPDGTRIAFASNRDGTYELYVMPSDGGAPGRLTVNDDDEGRPSWSPDGRSLAFMREHAGITDIYTIDLATRREQLLTPQSGSDSEPAWSPDGTRIAFNSARSGDFDIYVMQADGSHQVAITADPARDTYPAWSPDGRQVVFASNRSTAHFSDSDLYITEADGRSPARRLTHTPAGDVFPAWSRDGRWIAFVRSITEHHQILMVDVATGVERHLAAEIANEDQPAWSPDGRRIAYVANPSGNADIYVRAVK
jgi:DNA-binding winged helix-turn-helix (wHTH) protein/dipeptidyl aminopeptidase/acylaminoacyl peptidase